VSPPEPPLPDPHRIDRAALDRIIQRATELQTGDRDIGDNLTPEQVLELGKDVGIPARYLHQAMLEHRMGGDGPTVDPTVLGRVVGPREVGAQRVVHGDRDSVVAALIEWMSRNELLVLQRQQAGWVRWEPLGGMQAAIRRGTAALDTSKPKFMLSRADLVTATVTELETGYCHVALSATLKQARTAAIGGAVAGSSLGASAAIIAALLSPFWIVTIPPLAVGGALGWYVLRRFRPVVERVQLGLERALDYLERGGVKPGHAQLPQRGAGLLDFLAGEVRRALTQPKGRS
jgi:hypothetical protein